MDMNQILKNLESVENGTGEFKGEGTSEMKTILESLQSVDEGGMPPMAPPMTPPMDKGNPVSINVSMNATGKEHVADLLDMMKNAGLGGASEVKPDMMPMRTDIERLRDIVDGPKDESPCGDYSNSPNEEYGDVDAVTFSGDDMHKSKNPKDIRVKDPSGYEEESYANEPDEEYSDHNKMIHDLSGGLNKKKKQFAKAQDGDNAMAVKEKLKRDLIAQYEAMCGSKKKKRK